jgi:hypothetical protein
MRTLLAWLSCCLLGIVVIVPVHGQLKQELGAFRYDSSFIIGCHDMPRVDLAMDSLGMRFTQTYYRSIADIQRIIGQQHLGKTFVSGTWNNTTTPTTPIPRAAIENWADSIVKREYLAAYARGFGHIFAPDAFYFRVLDALALDQYYDADVDALQNLDISERSGGVAERGLHRMCRAGSI